MIPTLAELFSINYQITLSFSTLLAIALTIIGSCLLFIRYKFLTKYSNDPNANVINNDVKKDEIVDSINKKKRKNLNSNSNYLDEFLSAIKIFGYLERHVFHELTKNMTTQKLSWDEILYLDEKLGFLIVVDGCVQIFIKINENYNNPNRADNSMMCDLAELDYEKGEVLIIGNQRYQLLNEIKSGVPLSSLNSTLDLFNPFDEPESFNNSPVSVPMSSSSSLDLNTSEGNTMANGNESGHLGSQEIKHGTEASNNCSPHGKKLHDNPAGFAQGADEYPEIIARPKFHKHRNGATIAIIPALAFQRIQSKYPKDTAHIVTMVKNRLFKVTMNTIHNYLGLGDEIIDSEVKLNSKIESNLPKYLYDILLDRYTPKSNNDVTTTSVNNSIAATANASYNEDMLSKVHSASSNTMRHVDSNNSLEKLSRKKTAASLRSLNQPANSRKSSSRLVSLSSVKKPSHPGDLLSSVPISRKSIFNLEAYNLNNSYSSPFSPKNVGSTETTFSNEREETEETSSRIAIIENIFKLLGVNENSSIFKANNSQGGSSSLSTSSSMLGLTSLMSSNSEVPSSPGMLNHVNRNKIYENYTNRARFDSISSLGSVPGSRSESFSRAGSPKIYNTINQSQLRNYNRSSVSNVSSSIGGENNIDNIFEMSFRNRNNNHFDFGSVKDDYARNLDIQYFEPGKVIIEQDTFNSGLYYIIHGSLEVEYTTASNTPEQRNVTKKKGIIPQGGIAGYLSSILGIKSLTTIRAPANGTGVIIAHISSKSWNNLIDKYYQLQLPLAIKFKRLLSKQILTIDFALEWCQIPAGEVLAAEGDQANGFHIILSGRFRVLQSTGEKTKRLIDDNGKLDGDEFKVLGEYGHRESIGEVEVLTAARRTTSLIAVRDSETARIPRTLFEILSSQNPSIMVKVSRIVASKVASAHDDIRTMEKLTSSIASPQIINSSSSFQSPVSHISGNYKTITVLPTVNGLPVREFASRLIDSLKIIGRNVIALDQASILTHLGRHAFDDSLAQLKLSGFFATLEEQYETVVYICDSTLKSSWTSTCISQGDCVLLLANADDYEVAFGIGDFEKLLIKYKTTARTDLCLLHPEKYVTFGSTSIWLKNRSWVQGHHHIHMPIPNMADTEDLKKNNKSLIGDIAAKLSDITNPQLKQRLETVRSRLALDKIPLGKLKTHSESSTAPTEPEKNDFLRLARLLSNQAVGVVLGGGGARGISHLGVLTALERHGIPIDIIGGTSIGSFVGGLYGIEYNSVSIYGKVKKFSKRVSSYWRSLLDLTYPVTSYLTGYEFNRGIWKALGFSELEDSWIKFYCNSTNITNSTMDIHETGYLWRFIRASMSLAGLLPPIAYNGCMLLDGGYLDNLPVLEMKRRGIKYIFAVDVGSVDDRSPMNYGDTLSGLWVIFNRWNPFSKHPDVPNMMDIQSRLAYVASVNALEIAKRTPGVMYMRPPIDNYGTLDFGKFEEIYSVGLAYGEKIVTQWEKQGKLPKIVGRVKAQGSHDRPPTYRRNSL